MNIEARAATPPMIVIIEVIASAGNEIPIAARTPPMPANVDGSFRRDSTICMTNFILLPI